MFPTWGTPKEHLGNSWGTFGEQLGNMSLRFSGSNMIEQSSAPLQWQQHDRAEILSAADVVNLNESDGQQP
jgi:hypothetical protein